VRVGGTYSELAQQEMGVLQGSILSVTEQEMGVLQGSILSVTSTLLCLKINSMSHNCASHDCGSVSHFVLVTQTENQTV